MSTYRDADPEDAYDASDPPAVRLAVLAATVADLVAAPPPGGELNRWLSRLEWAAHLLDRLALHDDPDIAALAAQLRRELG